MKLSTSYQLDKYGISTTIKDVYYKKEIVVNTNEHEIVFAFFKNIMKSEELAFNFTNALFYISWNTGKPIMEYLDSMKSRKDKLEVTYEMAYLMNSIRSNSALIGITNVITPSYYISRNIAA